MRESKSAELAKKAISQTAAAWKNVETQWSGVKDNREFIEHRRAAESLITQAQSMGGEENRLIADLKAKQKEAQLRSFLQQFYIAYAKIRGIGRNRKILLRSYGVETAADVEQNRVQQISGFGPVVAGSLIAWRKSIEKRFVFNPNQPISPADIAAIKAAVLKKKSQLEGDLRQSLARLQNASNQTRSIRNSLQASAVQIWKAQKQAELNGTALINRFSVQARLAGIAAAMVVSFILLNAVGGHAKAAIGPTGRGVSSRINHELGRYQQKRVPVRRRFGDCCGRENRSGARPVLDNHGFRSFKQQPAF
jgi:hypothetical protein